MGSVKFGDAFRYIFNRPKGMLNALLLLIPIFGWFPLIGYVFRIEREFIDGKYKQLPLLSYKSDFKFGFMMFVKSLPFWILVIIVSSILKSSNLGIIDFLLNLLVYPIMGLNFVYRQTVKSYFEFNIVKKVFLNFPDYMLAFLKSIGLGLIFLVMILVLVGLPGIMFACYIFIADFYRRNVLKRKR